MSPSMRRRVYDTDYDKETMVPIAIEASVPESADGLDVREVCVYSGVAEHRKDLDELELQNLDPRVHVRRAMTPEERLAWMKETVGNPMDQAILDYLVSRKPTDMSATSEEINQNFYKYLQTYKTWKCSGCHATPPPDGFKRCLGCLFMTYCSKACQRDHWKHYHKQWCSLFRHQVQEVTNNMLLQTANSTSD